MRLTMTCFGCIHYTTYIIIFTIMLPSILFWLIFFPSSVKFHVIDASLTQFNLTSNNTLYYNFKVNVKVKNPNNDIIVYYRKITAVAWYKDNDFGWVSLTPFGQGHKNTNFLQIVFEGQSVIRLKPKQLGEYKDETRVGIYNDLDVDLDLRIRASYGRFGSSGFNPPIVECHRLSVPLISNSKSAPPISVTKCKTGSFFGSGILFWRRPSHSKYYQTLNMDSSFIEDSKFDSRSYKRLVPSADLNFVGVAALVISSQIVFIIRILYDL